MPTNGKFVLKLDGTRGTDNDGKQVVHNLSGYCEPCCEDLRCIRETFAPFEGFNVGESTFEVVDGELVSEDFGPFVDEPRNYYDEPFSRYQIPQESSWLQFPDGPPIILDSHYEYEITGSVVYIIPATVSETVPPIIIDFDRGVVIKIGSTILFRIDEGAGTPVNDVAGLPFAREIPFSVRDINKVTLRGHLLEINGSEITRLPANAGFAHFANGSPSGSRLVISEVTSIFHATTCLFSAELFPGINRQSELVEMSRLSPCPRNATQFPYFRDFNLSFQGSNFPPLDFAPYRVRTNGNNFAVSPLNTQPTAAEQLQALRDDETINRFGYSTDGGVTHYHYESFGPVIWDGRIILFTLTVSAPVEYDVAQGIPITPILGSAQYVFAADLQDPSIYNTPRDYTLQLTKTNVTVNSGDTSGALAALQSLNIDQLEIKFEHILADSVSRIGITGSTSSGYNTVIGQSYDVSGLFRYQAVRELSRGVDTELYQQIIPEETIFAEVIHPPDCRYVIEIPVGLVDLEPAPGDNFVSEDHEIPFRIELTAEDVGTCIEASFIIPEWNLAPYNRVPQGLTGDANEVDPIRVGNQILELEDIVIAPGQAPEILSELRYPREFSAYHVYEWFRGEQPANKQLHPPEEPVRKASDANVDWLFVRGRTESITPVVVGKYRIPLVWTIEGDLPNGMLFDRLDGTVLGVPNVSNESGSVTITATDKEGKEFSASYDWLVDPPHGTPEWSRIYTSENGRPIFEFENFDPLMLLYAGDEISNPLNMIHGTAPFTFQVVSGVQHESALLPDGMEIDVDTGELRGTPTGISNGDTNHEFFRGYYYAYTTLAVRAEDANGVISITSAPDIFVHVTDPFITYEDFESPGLDPIDGVNWHLKVGEQINLLPTTDDTRLVFSPGSSLRVAVAPGYSLPEGLELLDRETGEITGAMTEEISTVVRIQYTISGTGANDILFAPAFVDIVIQASE